MLSLGFTAEQVVNGTDNMCQLARDAGTGARTLLENKLRKANERAANPWAVSEKLPVGIHPYNYPATKGFGDKKKVHPKAGQFSGSYTVIGPNGQRVFGKPADLQYILHISTQIGALK